MTRMRMNYFIHAHTNSSKAVRVSHSNEPAKVYGHFIRNTHKWNALSLCQSGSDRVAIIRASSTPGKRVSLRFQRYCYHRLEDKPIHLAIVDHSQPICRPLFCSSSQLISGLKYSIIARVEMSSPVASFKTLRQSSLAPFFKMLFSHVPTSLLSA